MKYATLSLLAVIALVLAAPAKAWDIPEDSLVTRWASQVSPENALPEYPRPQMVRDDWQNLNGVWELEVAPRDAAQPTQYTQEILVPYPIESALSGLKQRVDAGERIWYRRTFHVPEAWDGQRVILHFGAVDWEAAVYVNGREVATHRGGYDAFAADITDHLTADADQELVVAVWDPTDAAGQARGKQVSNPGGIMYTPTSGIWQTVWLEPVPAAHIKDIELTPDLENSCLWVTVFSSAENARVVATAKDGESEVATVTGLPGETLRLEIPADELKLWSPDSPFLYDLVVELKQGEETSDRVASYFGMRSIAIGPDENGVTCILFNGEPMFLIGPLDQGFWPDGLYTAATDDALRYDIEVTKELGFNMTRKHVKIEPARWYYWCDKLGLIVLQDMPAGDNRSAEDQAQFRSELEAMVDGFRNHPSIVMWIPFNEGWGQHDTPAIVDFLHELDPSRPVDQASGWHDRGVGDVHDVHHYPYPVSPDPEPTRAAVLGEFGGLGLPVPEHAWTGTGWGYQAVADGEELATRYEELLAGVAELVSSPGLSAAVYTQITDVETETNGLLTYDREVIKAPADRIARANAFYFPPNFAGSPDIFVEGTAIRVAHPREDAAVRYTLDGSEPTADSPLYSEPLEIADNTTVTVRAFWADGTVSAAVSQTFHEVKPQAAVIVDDVQRGLLYGYYEGEWTALPDFAALQPAASGVAEGVDLTQARRGDSFGLSFTGYVRVPVDGVYNFYLASDDGSRLYIDGEKVIDNDGLHAAVEEQGFVPLAAGLHPISVSFFEAAGGEVLELQISGPDLPRQAVPTEMFFHSE